MRPSLWTGAGAILAAAAFSACCWIPLLAVAVGFSAGGAAVGFERYRWLFLPAAFAFLALGFFLNERRVGTCGPDGGCPAPRPGQRRFNRVVLGISTLLVAVVAAFPGGVGRLSSSPAPVGTGRNTVRSTLTIPVEGMTCVGCEASVEAALRGVPGVSSAKADFDLGSATVRLAGRTAPAPGALDSALSRAGYRAR